MPAEFGKRVWLWLRAGITTGDLEAARDVLRSACWASDVRVVVNDRRSHIVVLEVIRRPPPGGPGDTPSGWPYLDLDRGEAGGPGPGETAAYYGLGLPPPVPVKEPPGPAGAAGLPGPDRERRRWGTSGQPAGVPRPSGPPAASPEAGPGVTGPGPLPAFPPVAAPAVASPAGAGPRRP